MVLSPGYQLFFQHAPDVARAWMSVNQLLDQTPALDRKTSELAYLAVLAALGLQQGIGFHAAEARTRGASREEVVAAILVGLPAAGHRVVEALPAAIAAFDATAAD